MYIVCVCVYIYIYIHTHIYINFRKAYNEIDQALEACLEKMSTKNKLKSTTLSPWRESALTMVKEKLSNLSKKYSPNKQNQHYVILMSNHI